eukprot:271199-Alexandrium_andersonii.AAC.1
MCDSQGGTAAQAVRSGLLLRTPQHCCRVERQRSALPLRRRTPPASASGASRRQRSFGWSLGALAPHGEEA